MLPDWMEGLYLAGLIHGVAYFRKFRVLIVSFLIGTSPFELKLSQVLKVLIYGVI